MTKLKLHVPEPEHADAPIPFPGRAADPAWRPRLTEHDAERAVREVESRVARLAAILNENGDDDDRPRAA